jgi:hypothetical protein
MSALKRNSRWTFVLFVSKLGSDQNWNWVEGDVLEVRADEANHLLFELFGSRQQTDNPKIWAML